MKIRAEQMAVFETASQESFVRRIADHLNEHYAESRVILPDSESVVEELSDEKLYSLIEVGIKRAQTYEINLESTISAFVALMFEVAPNFDTHRLSQMMLNDETIIPNKRIDELLDVLTDKNWETVREKYDANAWLPQEQVNTEEQTLDADTDS